MGGKTLIHGIHFCFRYENAILITNDGCETMSKTPLGVEVIE
jgi:Xaa-Pro aminopeptidase